MDSLTFALVPLGLGAGALSVVAGMGGGLALLAVLSSVASPVQALTLTAPALLFGNLHRAVTYRASAERAVVLPLTIGAFIGASLGGTMLAAIPATLVQVGVCVMTVLGLVRVLRGWTMSRHVRALGPAGFVVGALTATSGGAGLLIGPVVLSTGARGDAYVATIATTAVAMHLGRTLGYGVGGLLTSASLAHSALLAAALVAGSVLGVRARAHLDAATKERIELGSLVVCVALTTLETGRHLLTR